MLDVNDEELADVEEVLEVVTTAKLITEVVTTTRDNVNAASVQDTPITTAKATKVTVEVPKPRKRRGVIIQDPKETTTTVTVQLKVQAKDKGKAILIEEPKPLKRQVQIDLDEEVARQLEAELNVDINWNAVIEQVKRSETLTDAVMKYQALKRKPLTEAQARRNMIIYLKNMAGYKMIIWNNLQTLFKLLSLLLYILFLCNLLLKTLIFSFIAFYFNFFFLPYFFLWNFDSFIHVI
nr:hypothetical protein [Tanacetum cinerariifolium]